MSIPRVLEDLARVTVCALEERFRVFQFAHPASPLIHFEHNHLLAPLRIFTNFRQSILNGFEMSIEVLLEYLSETVKLLLVKLKPEANAIQTY